MGGFFKGWRRKMGAVTLVLACMFAVDWIRLADYAVKEGRTSDVPWLPTVMHPQLGVPYWWIVLPLTLLSGYLLLGKPRQSDSEFEGVSNQKIEQKATKVTKGDQKR